MGNLFYENVRKDLAGCVVSDGKEKRIVDELKIRQEFLIENKELKEIIIRLDCAPYVISSVSAGSSTLTIQLSPDGKSIIDEV